MLEKNNVIFIDRSYNNYTLFFHRYKNGTDPKLCIYEGYLIGEPNSNVVVTGGCEGSNSFDVSA
jgi:hypothetical protein